MILILPIIALALWILSIFLVKSWRHFWLYLITNFLIVLIYTINTLYGKLEFIGHDEYGLGRLMLLFVFPIAHAVIGFIFALVINRFISASK
ncbi:hypothetical protein [Flagellimonas eckloniae]|uniref:Uncharacterized protein n=1 Tax=Flagellimonas eckloniae TaxID=346185 RepID=A0A0Q0WVW9_9FLAO|nr:hypothetical protein [Allomuricauda eckloniae]KQC29640.1 hypothetical protein AAY42_06880 [Allomuricauda eckloniae]